MITYFLHAWLNLSGDVQAIYNFLNILIHIRSCFFWTINLLYLYWPTTCMLLDGFLRCYSHVLCGESAKNVFGYFEFICQQSHKKQGILKQSCKDLLFWLNYQLHDWILYILKHRSQWNILQYTYLSTHSMQNRNRLKLSKKLWMWTSTYWCHKSWCLNQGMHL